MQGKQTAMALERGKFVGGLGSALVLFAISIIPTGGRRSPVVMVAEAKKRSVSATLTATRSGKPRVNTIETSRVHATPRRRRTMRYPCK